MKLKIALAGILATLVTLVAAPFAYADQAHLVASDGIAQYVDVKSARSSISTNTPGAGGYTAQQGGLFFAGIRVMNPEFTGMIQAGWIHSNGPIFGNVDPTPTDPDGCIPIGTTVRGYWVEWLHPGNPFLECLYFPTTAAKYGKNEVFELRNLDESDGTCVPPGCGWVVSKNGSCVIGKVGSACVNGLALGFDYGYGSVLNEWLSNTSEPCYQHASYGTSSVNDSFRIQRNGSPDLAINPYITLQHADFRVPTSSGWVTPIDPHTQDVWSGALTYNPNTLSNASMISFAHWPEPTYNCTFLW